MAGEEHFEVVPDGLRVAARGFHTKADHLMRLHQQLAVLVDGNRLAPLVGDNDNAKTFLAGFTRSGGGVRDVVGGWGTAIRVTGDVAGGMAENYDLAERYATDSGRGLGNALANITGGGPVNNIVDNLSTRR
ncbi:hypothetical protein [Crossiella cryophila]|uniref:Uncharacterized protein n=1 Tax=Crossiella cryophila TaxID=43355 RepID=A0A7W7FWA7_9PSEU|nr:hypothetical protein [Crossiella cryophila]MBB4679865.1 hypothetical protein [Crossiella cryophila]